MTTKHKSNKGRRGITERIPDKDRKAIAQAIRDGGTCRGIAAKFKKSPSTVRAIATEFKVEQPFARTKTAKACAAKQIDNKAKRTELLNRLWDYALHASTRLTVQSIVYDWDKDGGYHEHRFKEPTYEGARTIMQTIFTAIRSISGIEAIDRGVIKVDITATLRQVAEREGLDPDEVQQEAERILADNKL